MSMLTIYLFIGLILGVLGIMNGIALNQFDMAGIPASHRKFLFGIFVVVALVVMALFWLPLIIGKVTDD